MAAPLLVEILTEELPPKSLRALAEAFRDRLVDGLVKAQLAPRGTAARSYATPRRLAVLIPGVASAGEDRETEVTGPSAKAPAQAIEGFARKHGLSAGSLERRSTPKGEVVVARVKAKGRALDEVLAPLAEEALKSLPIPKVMRWGAGDEQFVRPVHGLVMLHGKMVVPGTVLGLHSGNRTRGHRFMDKGEVVLKQAEEYEATMSTHSVIVAFENRKAVIESLLQREAEKQKGSLGEYRDLLDEVTALVEHPSVYVGRFDASFLDVPQECLILTMRQNQKYFPLFDAQGKLLAKFLIVSNMRVDDPGHIVGGNERVVRPRLEDARFFYDQDRKVRLEARVPELARVVYHNKLGSQLERVERIQLATGRIARALKADALQAERAAWLSKADLLTGMVGEFPELQGVMGRYYALHDGEPRAVADAIEAHYRPRFAGDRLPEGHLACALALADKLDALAGLFGIGQQPTGEKDPFGLRRAALGVVRILVERKLPLSLHELVVQPALRAFIYERFAGYLKEQAFTTLQIDAVLSQEPSMLGTVPQRLEAIKAFQALPEAESLAAANKRVANILKQAEAKGESFSDARLEELKEPGERALHQALRSAAKTANSLFEQGDYAGYLKTFSVLKQPVDSFFDSVMVMVEDKKLRQGRLALLRDLRDAMNRVADISRLAQ